MLLIGVTSIVVFCFSSLLKFICFLRVFFLVDASFWPIIVSCNVYALPILKNGPTGVCV